MSYSFVFYKSSEDLRVGCSVKYARDYGGVFGYCQISCIVKLIDWWRSNIDMCRCREFVLLYRGFGRSVRSFVKGVESLLNFLSPFLSDFVGC